MLLQNFEFFVGKNAFVAHLLQNPSIGKDMQTYWCELYTQGWRIENRFDKNLNKNCDMFVFSGGLVVKDRLVDGWVDASNANDVYRYDLNQPRSGLHCFHSRHNLMQFVSR